MENINKIASELTRLISELPLKEQIEALNTSRQLLHSVSPFKDEPVDCVMWVQSEDVTSNDYNPNKVAPPEMELLEISIINDGYTQPIVAWGNSDKGKVEVIDGFHRHRVGKESKLVNQRIHGYLPIVNIRNKQTGKNDRIASTIRHNRARGKHQIDAMSEIVLELKNRNWTNTRIAKELGMDEDEILRLCQITGLEHLFTDADFSMSWESSDVVDEYEELTDDVFDEETRTINTNDENRIFHTWDKWECHKAGFYASHKDGMTANQCQLAYAEFLSNNKRFAEALESVIIEWKHSCEHYLTNKSMNRIAWLGQAAMCYATGVPSKYCSGFNLLTNEQQNTANEIALIALNTWLSNNDMDEVDMNDALSLGRQVNIY